MSDEDQAGLRDALKRTAVALKQADIAFALGGGYAAWARGGPEPEHDADFIVAETDVGRAERVLTKADLRVEHPPEDWLFKVFTDDAMVDLVFRVAGVPVEAPILERAEEFEVLSVRMPVLAATDLLGSKLNALSEQECDYSRLLPVARAVREQVDWERLRDDVAGNDFAVAFLFLVERMGIVKGAAPVLG